MKKLKVLSVILLIVCVLSMNIIPLGAAAATVTEKTKALDTLTLLKNTTVGSNSTGLLKRSEAFVFIVRLLGKEAYVLSNATTYKKSLFPDVLTSAWYAPYISYCSEQKIVGGYANGKFGPNDTLSEKTFLRVILSNVLGYKYGTDFTLDNIYQIAYDLRLLDDSKYQSNPKDNLKYTNGEALKVIYNALSMEVKGTNITLIQSLINNKVVARDIALSLGLVKDVPVSAIDKVTLTSDISIDIKFNEQVKNIIDSNVKVYEADNSANKLTVSVVSQAGDALKLKTSSQKPTKNYIVEISNVEDLEGNIIKSVVKAFTGYTIVETKSDFFKISKVEPVSKNIINLYFTQPINTNCELGAYYEISQAGSPFVIGSTQTMIVKTIKGVDNGVSIYLKDKTFDDGLDYSIKATGKMVSVYGVKLNDGVDESKTFLARGNENEDLKINGINALNSTKLVVEFNKELDSNFAQKAVNYTVTGPSSINIPVTGAVIGGVGSKKGKVVTLTLSTPVDKTKEYKFYLEYVTDIYKQTKLEGYSYTFSGAYPDKSYLTIDYAAAIDKGSVWVYFNKPLDPTYATINGYYSITNSTNSGNYTIPTKVVYNEAIDQFVAKLYLPSDKYLNGTTSYKLKVLNVMPDATGNISTSNLEFVFAGTANDVTKPTISSATAISKDTVLLKFNNEIAVDLPTVLTSNYSLEYVDSGTTITRIPICVIYVDNMTLALKFDDLDFTKNYTVRFKTLTGYSGISSGSLWDSANSKAVVIGK